MMLTEALGTTQITTALTLTQLLTFTIFVLFYIPCASTIAAMSRELGWKGAATAAGLSSDSGHDSGLIDERLRDAGVLKNS